MMFSARSLWLLALVALSMTAFGRSGGFYDPASLLLFVLVAAGACFVLLRFQSLNRRLPVGFPRWLLFGVVLADVVFQSQGSGLLYARNERLLADTDVMGYLLVGLVVLQCPLWLQRLPRKGLVVICALCAATAAAIVLLTPLVSPDPAIDVITVQQEAAASVRAGENPYQKREFTNIYGRRVPWYPGGRMRSYPYPPLTLLAPLCGDPRWMLAFGHLFGALAVFLIGRRTLPLPESFWLSLLALYPPNARFVVEQGWTDPNLVAAFSLMALAYRWRRLTLSLVSVGLILAFKQSMVILVPLVWMLWPALKLRQYLWAALIPLVTMAPFALWAWPDGAEAMYADLVTFHVLTPFRPDALTLSAWCFRLTGKALPFAYSAVGLAGLAVGLWVLMRKMPLADLFSRERFLAFLLAFEFTYLLTLLFSKHAFANYFYLFQVLLVLAFAWSRVQDSAAAEST